MLQVLQRVMMVFVMAVMISPALTVIVQDGAYASEQTNPRSEYWREVRKGVSGSASSSFLESGELIENGGENWRRIRNGVMITWGGWMLSLAFLAILGMVVFRGKIKLEGGLSGQTVDRWSLAKRINHWVVAGTFIILALTGVALMFGKAILIPLLGKDVFSSLALASKVIHNYVGPLFGVALLAFLIPMFKHNLLQKHDIDWFKRGGGFVAGKHPSAGRMNGGEKVLYWVLLTAGTGVIISGFVLDFQNLGQVRDLMQVSHVVHAAASIMLMAVISGHIYIAFAMEGSLDGMLKGKVDVRWAEQHHDLWYKEVSTKGRS